METKHTRGESTPSINSETVGALSSHPASVDASVGSTGEKVILLEGKPSS